LALFESCFPLKNGTPRQGILAPNSQGRIKISPYRGTTPKDVLEGLEQYSHVWIVFWFHGNANKHMRAKVQPPRLNGISVGCLATRTPHRLIPIGMTAAKLLRIENGDTLIVSGIDLIDGTPILDIKPYVPRYDSIPDAICPEWMIQPTGSHRKLDYFIFNRQSSALKSFFLLSVVRYHHGDFHRPRSCILGKIGTFTENSTIRRGSEADNRTDAPFRPAFGLPEKEMRQRSVWISCRYTQRAMLYRRQ
jgi:tRNA-Thr(GGU) m(6)t(6)A37 methyltransferase TsaA